MGANTKKEKKDDGNSWMDRVRFCLLFRKRMQEVLLVIV
jgi:hypothetical protein